MGHIEHHFVIRGRKSGSSVRKKVLSLHSLHGLHGLQSAVYSLHGLRFGVTDGTWAFTLKGDHYYSEEFSEIEGVYSVLNELLLPGGSLVKCE